MNGDDDIAAALPRPPLPAPARREAAISEALRRFDGGEAGPPVAAAGTGAPRPSPWRIPAIRPWAGALVGAVLVAVIALPIMLTKPDGLITPEPDKEASPAAPTADPPVTAGPETSARPTERPAASRAGTVTPPDPAQSTRAAGPGADEEARFADAATPPPPPPAPAQGRQEKAAEPAPDARAAGEAAAGLASRDVTVTGSRIRRPNLESAAPVTTVSEDDDSNVIVTGTRRDNAKASRPGDWNACTVDDPRRSLTACRRLVNPAARGTAGQASAFVADGLARAWEGDLDGAIAKFDRAIETAPRSSLAYLNRGLAWRRNGDLDRALADLDRAVRHAPTSARAYFNRARILRERGDVRRARVDENRAADLDPDYGDLFE